MFPRLRLKTAETHDHGTGDGTFQHVDPDNAPRHDLRKRKTLSDPDLSTEDPDLSTHDPDLSNSDPDLRG